MLRFSKTKMTRPISASFYQDYCYGYTYGIRVYRYINMRVRVSICALYEESQAWKQKWVTSGWSNLTDLSIKPPLVAF